MKTNTTLSWLLNLKRDWARTRAIPVETRPKTQDPTQIWADYSEALEGQTTKDLFQRQT